MPLALFK